MIHSTFRHAGISIEALAIFILFTLSFTVLLAYTSGYIPFLSHSETTSLCRQSVNIHAGKPLEVFRGSIMCPPERIRITGKLNSPKAQQEAKTTLARALTTCWRNFGEGRLDLFSKPGVYCNLCSFIDFTEKKSSLTGVTLFLANTTMPYSDITYLDYLAGHTTPHFRNLVNNPTLFNAYEAATTSDIPDTSTRYATIFIYTRGEDAINSLLDTYLTPKEGGSGGRLLGAGGAGIIGGTLGATAGILFFGTGPIGWTAGALSAITVSGSTLYSISRFTDKPHWMAFTRLIPYDAPSLKELGCEQIGAQMR